MAGSTRKPRVPGPEARERLIQASIELMKEMPVVKLTTRKIAERAGLDQRVISRQFGGETELLLAAADELLRRSSDRAEQELGRVPQLLNEEYVLRTRLIAYLVLCGVDEELLRERELPDHGAQAALEFMGVPPETPDHVKEVLLTLFSVLAQGRVVFGDASARATPENLLGVVLLTRYMAAMGPKLGEIVRPPPSI